MIAILDYGVGNLFSLKSSLDKLGFDNIITGDKKDIMSCDRLILPGVGSFKTAMSKLNEKGLSDVVYDFVSSGRYMMGICLGMQLLYKRSFEFGECEGLGFLEGDIVPLSDKLSDEFLIPHMGWNSLEIINYSPLLKDIDKNSFVYFVHSYYAELNKIETVAYSDYGVEVTAISQKDNVFGCQFHPEKSGKVGLTILKNFCEIK